MPFLISKRVTSDWSAVARKMRELSLFTTTVSGGAYVTGAGTSEMEMWPAINWASNGRYRVFAIVGSDPDEVSEILPFFSL